MWGLGSPANYHFKSVAPLARSITPKLILKVCRTIDWILLGLGSAVWQAVHQLLIVSASQIWSGRSWKHNVMRVYTLSCTLTVVVQLLLLFSCCCTVLIVCLYCRRAHTVLTLVIFCAIMVYVAAFEDPSLHDNAYNFKRYCSCWHYAVMLKVFVVYCWWKLFVDGSYSV